MRFCWCRRLRGAQHNCDLCCEIRLVKKGSVQSPFPFFFKRLFLKWLTRSRGLRVGDFFVYNLTNWLIN